MSRPTLRTAFCDRVGIEYPVVLAGMGPVAGTGAPVANAELAAAVSQAGGLGVMGGVAYAPDVLRAEIRKIRSLTDKPFGVDLLLAPTSWSRAAARALRARRAQTGSRDSTSRRSSASLPPSASSSSRRRPNPATPATG